MNDMSTKEFPVPVLLSITSGGVLICEFDAVRECADYVMGYELYTHELAHRPLLATMRARILAQHPDLGGADLGGVNKANWEEARDALIAQYGPTRTLTSGTTERTKHPLETLHEVAPGKPVVVVVAGEKP